MTNIRQLIDVEWKSKKKNNSVEECGVVNVKFNVKFNAILFFSTKNVVKQVIRRISHGLL